jgi:glycosyltransferase involved in cell wall biosynthesis
MDYSQELLISVIIPTYNRAHLITDAIDSVLNQTYENFELLVIDDHSTDDTKDVVKHYDDPRIKYLLNKRKKGAQGARNTGILNSGGDYISFLDSDDQWLNDKLEVQLNEMSKSGTKFSYTNRIVKTEKEQIKYDINPTDLYKENYIGTFSSVMISKKLQKKAGLLDEFLLSCQDWDYWIRIRDYATPYLIEKPLVVFNHQNHERITNTSSDSLQGHKKILEKYYSEIGEKGFLSCHYYKIALISGEISFLLKAISLKVSPKKIARIIYHNYLR